VLIINLPKQDYEATKAASYCMVQSSPIQHIAEARRRRTATANG